MKTKNNPTRQDAQDLILLAHLLSDNMVVPAMDIREILLALSEANLTLTHAPEDDATAIFALQLLNNPQMREYDSTMEIVI